MLSAVLTLAAPLAGTAATEPTRAHEVTATHAGDTAKPNDDAEARAEGRDDGEESASSQQLFSTLGALGLGVLGLLWMRRRAAAL